MKNYVRLAGNVVAENIAIGDTQDIAKMFHPDIPLVAVSAPQVIGSTYNATSGAFSPPVVAPPSKADLIEYAALRRYTVETGGVTVNGIKIATDRESQSMLSAAYNMASLNSSFTTMWKADDGTFNSLTAAQIVALAVAVGGFVASCFSAEAAAVTAINTGSITTPAQIDAAIVVPS